MGERDGGDTDSSVDVGIGAILVVGVDEGKSDAGTSIGDSDTLGDSSPPAFPA